MMSADMDASCTLFCIEGAFEAVCVCDVLAISPRALCAEASKMMINICKYWLASLCGDGSGGFKVLHELDLWTGLWAVRVALALLNCLPEACDHAEGVFAALGSL